jgi:LysM repeat protein
VVTRGHDRIARFAAPAAFLVAATIAILIVRSGLGSEDGAVNPVRTQATAAATTTEPAAETPTPGTTATVPAGAELYEIQPGDTLAVIAEEHGTSVEQLLVLNPDIDPVALTVGQEIRVK